MLGIEVRGALLELDYLKCEVYATMLSEDSFFPQQYTRSYLGQRTALWRPVVGRQYFVEVPDEVVWSDERLLLEVREFMYSPELKPNSVYVAYHRNKPVDLWCQNRGDHYHAEFDKYVNSLRERFEFDGQ